MSRSSSVFARVLLAIALVGLLGLGGCRQDEQGRVLRYDKGKYLGQADAKMSQQTLDRLRIRAQGQRAN